MHDVCFRAPACAYVSARDCVCVTVCVRDCVHVCQSEGMDACQRREQHHVRVLADDAHFRYTNSNSQLSHETISSHDSSTPFPSASCVSRAGYCKVQQQSYLSLSQSKLRYLKIIRLQPPSGKQVLSFKVFGVLVKKKLKKFKEDRALAFKSYTNIKYIAEELYAI